MNFSYNGYTQEGGKVSGEIAASDRLEAISLLASESITVVEISPVSEAKANLSLFSNKITNKELELFTSQLATLLKNKLKIDKALQLLSKTISKGPLSSLIQKVLAEVKGGISLSESLEKTNQFDDVYINLIRVGEVSGNLEQVMAGLAKDLQFKAELSSRVRQATAYPMMILVFCFFALLFIFNFIVPKMSVMFEDAEQLPIYTEILLSVTDFVIQYQFIIIAVVIGCTFGLIYMTKQSSEFKSRVQDFVMKIPGLRKVLQNLESLKFCSSMNLCIENGVLLEKALSLSVKSVSVLENQKKIESILRKVKSGESLSRGLGQTDLLDSLQLGILEVGEESGDLSSVLNEISDRTRKSFEEKVNKLTSLLEPLLIITMGIIVGSIVIVMLMSIISAQDVAL